MCQHFWIFSEGMKKNENERRAKKQDMETHKMRKRKEKYVLCKKWEMMIPMGNKRMCIYHGATRHDDVTKC